MAEGSINESKERGAGEQGQETNGGTIDPAEYMELYKLAVEMADRVSARRGTANAFFVTVNTALLAFLGLSQLNAAWPVAVGGLAVSITWVLQIKSYRDLNRAKFKVINNAEKRFPLKVYSDEWQYLKKDRRYLEFTIVEMVVPVVFAVLYLAILLF